MCEFDCEDRDRELGLYNLSWLYILIFIFFFFFFSSRRRHTRCSRDWSSDVCSSDLAAGDDDEAAITAAVPSGQRAGELVERVVAADILAHRQQAAVGRRPAGGVGQIGRASCRERG